MPITPAAHGTALNKPILSASVTPVALMMVGSQKLMPYSENTNRK